MAAGNDGNLLQHWVEADLAARLLGADTRRPLHVVLTHGMSPFEKFKERKTGFKRLDGWLAVAELARANLPPNLPAVVRAYATCAASADHYPNSAEVLAALVGRENLRGVVTEYEQAKVADLNSAWSGHSLRVLPGSWRKNRAHYACPKSLAVPWLLSMDPMTFLPDPDDGPSPDDANLRPSDLKLVGPVLKQYLGSGQRGAAVIFCFSLRPSFPTKPDSLDYRRFFKENAAAFARGLGCACGFCEVPLSNAHVGAIFSADSNLITAAVTEWENRRDAVLTPRRTKK
jgi:hypothetical protein